MAERAARQGFRAPLAIYEVHLGSWRRSPEEGHRVLNYREIADAVGGLRREDGFYPRGIDAGDGVSAG